MPSMLTHRVLGDDVIREINPDRKVIRAIDDDGFELYSIGTSGPDIFFFFAAFPWANPKRAYEVSKYGSWMHAEKTDLIFRTMASQCKKTMDSCQIAYTAGVLLHWALDHIAHPYVFNRTGTGAASNTPHRYFESQLDCGVIQWKKIDITKFRPYTVVDYKPDTWYTIWQLYDEVLRNGWGTELKTTEAEQAVKDFSKIEHYLYDPKGTKMKLVLKAEKAGHLDGLASSMIIPRRMDPAWDVMNEEHHLWHHPSTNEEHHESFKELYEQARVCGISLLNSFSDYLENKDDIEKLMSQITGNFHTGLPVPDDMKFFDLVPTRVPDHLTD